MDGQRSDMKVNPYNPSHTMSSHHEFGYIIMVNGSKTCGWGTYCWSYRNRNIFVSLGLVKELMLPHLHVMLENVLKGVSCFVLIVKTLSSM